MSSLPQPLGQPWLRFILARFRKFFCFSIAPLMKVNPTIALTLTLLSLMFGAGIVSAAWGLVVGREALKGITQPDTRPTNPTAQGTPRREEVAILREEDLVVAAKARMNGAGGDPAIKLASATKAESKAVVKAANAEFPLVSQSFGVTLEVNSVRQQGDSVVMQVSLKNTGKEPVRFLYDSLLALKDEKGEAIAATVQGLPTELPASGEAFSGTVTISAELVKQVEKLSLSITDYPDQHLQLQLPNIPIIR